MKIYFGGSIRGGRDDKELYFQLIALLQKHGTVLTEHIGAANLSADGEVEYSDKLIYDRDMAWIAECDVVVAEVTQPSLGVGYELRDAELRGKPILALYRPQEGRRLSAMITGSTISVREYQTAEDAAALFEGFFTSLASAA